MQAKQPRVKVKAKRTVNIANAVARSVNQTARHTAKQTRPPLRAPLYTPITPRARRQASAKVGTTQPHGRGAVVVSQHPKHPFPKQKVISHNAVVRAKQRESNKRALNLSKTNPLAALKDPTHPIPTFSHSLVGEGLTHALHRQATLMGQAQQGAASGAIPGATIQVKGNPARVGRITQNAVKDAINLPVQTLQSGYQVVHATAKAVGGDTTELKQIGEGLKNHTFLGNVLQGHWKQAGKQLEEHPLGSALEVSGAKAILGRGIGASLRTAGKAGIKSAAKAGSTERAPLKLYHHVEGGPTHPRTYSRDSINKLIQVQSDKQRVRVAKRQGHDPQGASRAPRAGVKYRTQQEKLLANQMNSDIAMTEGVRKAKISEARAQVAASTKGGKVARVRLKTTVRPKAKRLKVDNQVKGLEAHHADAIPLSVERVLTTPRHVVRDLRRYKTILDKTDKSQLSHHELELHQRMVDQIDGLLNNKEFRANPGPAFEAAQKVINGEAPRTAALLSHHMLSQDELAAAYKPYAIVHMGAKPTKATNPVTGDPMFLVDKKGRPLTVDHVKAHMQARGVPEPGFYSQRPGATGKGSFYTAVAGKNLKRPVNYSKQRTGLSTLQGTHEASLGALDAQAAHSANLATQAQGHDFLFSRYGIHKTNPIGQRTFWKSHNEARTAADELSPNVGVDLVPVNVGKAKAIQDLLDTGKLGREGQAGISGKVQAMFNDSGHGQYILVPKMLRDKLLASVHPRGDFRRGLEEFTKNWKAAVLTTSVKWPAGNALDLTIRSANEAIGPTRIIRGHRYLTAMEKVNPEAAMQLRARTVGAFMHAQEQQGTYRVPGRIAQLPVIRQARFLWRTWYEKVYAVNGAGESLASYGALGKWAGRQMDGFTKMSKKGLEDLAKGTVDTQSQLAAAQYVERVIGRWGKYSPELKAALVNAPFVQWLGVAMKYVYVTLPVHHPIKTGIAAGIVQMTEEERKKLGLNIDPFKDPKKTGELPGYQQGDIMLPNGKLLPVGQLSSLGIARNLPEGVADFILPQAATAYGMLKYGVDFTGQPLKNPDGSTPTRSSVIQQALYTVFEGNSPFVSTARRLQEGGGASNPMSTVFDPKTWSTAPGSGLGAALDKVLNPLHEQKPNTFGQNKKSKGRSVKVRAIQPGEFSTPSTGTTPGQFKSTPGGTQPGVFK